MFQIFLMYYLCRMRLNRILLLLSAITVLTPACKKAANPNDENEHEAINKVEMVFTRPGVGTTIFLIEDPDGEGGNPPSRIDTIKLNAGITYMLDVRIKNIVSGRETDLTSTIVAQGKAHEMYFIPTGITINISKNDRDASGYPIGLKSTWAVGTPGNGTLLLKLMHKTGIKGPTDAPNVGHADLQVVIPIRITI